LIELLKAIRGLFLINMMGFFKKPLISDKMWGKMYGHKKTFAYFI
jgi:hypothetical protein